MLPATVTISVLSHSSVDIQRGLDDFTLDAGLTYLDNEPLARVRGIPLYSERYFAVGVAPLDNAADQMRWGDAARLPLCLLSNDMQNRRILDATFALVGKVVRPGIETNSVLAKIGLFLVLTCLAPIAIPVYLILRHHRHSHA